MGPIVVPWPPCDPRVPLVVAGLSLCFVAPLRPQALLWSSGLLGFQGAIVVPGLIRPPNDPQAPLWSLGLLRLQAPVVTSGLHSCLKAPLSQIGVGSS